MLEAFVVEITDKLGRKRPVAIKDRFISSVDKVPVTVRDKVIKGLRIIRRLNRSRERMCLGGYAFTLKNALFFSAPGDWRGEKARIALLNLPRIKGFIVVPTARIVMPIAQHHNDYYVARARSILTLGFYAGRPEW